MSKLGRNPYTRGLTPGERYYGRCIHFLCARRSEKGPSAGGRISNEVLVSLVGYPAPTGDVWDEVIERQLAECACVVVLWSRTSINRHWVGAEATEGLERGILVPALVDKVRPPLVFRTVQAEDLTDWNGDTDHLGLLRLLDAVASRVAYTKSATERAEELNAECSGNAKNSSEKQRVRNQSGFQSSATTRKQAKFRYTGLFALLLMAAAAIFTYRYDNSEDDSQRAEKRPVFRDCNNCPSMVALPGGTFLMGSPDDEAGRFDSEGPQHQVTVKPFAIGRFEVTFDKWDLCFDAGSDACNGYRPDDEGWGREGFPVINVSWHDAKAYADWLAKKTGKSYRLPTEAEWEYAARAGTTTPYASGRSISHDQANCGSKNGTEQVGATLFSFSNAWGLFDMHGNVWEWVEDCWRASYQEPAQRSSNNTKNTSTLRTVRGGSWYDDPSSCRSAARAWLQPATREPRLGFRVARSLD